MSGSLAQCCSTRLRKRNAIESGAGTFAEKENNDETVTGEVGNSWYSKQDIHEIFQNLVSQYFNVLNTQFSNYKPISDNVPKEQSLKDEKCFEIGRASCRERV